MKYKSFLFFLAILIIFSLNFVVANDVDNISIASVEEDVSIEVNNDLSLEESSKSPLNHVDEIYTNNNENKDLLNLDEPTVIYIGHHNNTDGGDGSYNSPFSTFKSAFDSVYGENNVTIKVFDGVYYLGEGMSDDESAPLKINTNNLNIMGCNGSVVIKNYFNDNGALNAEAFSLTSSSANFTFSNLIFDASECKVSTYEYPDEDEYNFFLPFYGKANLGIFDNCSFVGFGLKTASYLMSPEYNSKFINCYFDNSFRDHIFYSEFPVNTNHLFDYCIFTENYKDLAVINIPCNIFMDNVWFGQNSIPDYITPNGAYIHPYTEGYIIPVNRYAQMIKEHFSITYLGNNQYEIIGKLTWNGTEDQEGMENFQPMTVELESEDGQYKTTATLVNGNFKTIYTSSNPNNKLTVTLHNQPIPLEFNTVDITADPVNIYYGNDQNITFNFAQAITANVTITVSNGSYNKSERVEIIGKDSLVYTVPDTLKEGTYDIEINLADNNYYGFNTTTLTVSKVSDYKFEVVPSSNVKVGDTATITVTLPDDVNGTVTVKFGNETKSLPAKASMVFNFTNLKAITYAVNVTYTGNDKYTFRSIPDSVSVDKADSSLEINDAVFTYGDVIAIPFSVTNANGVTVSVLNKDEVEVANTSSNSNIITLDALPAGEYTLYVMTVVDNDNYNWVDKSPKLTINKANSSINIQDKEFTYATEAIINAVTVNSTGNVIATLYDENNNEIAVSVSGDNITLPLLNAGKYTLSVTTNVDANHINVTKTATVTIVKATPIISVDVPENGIFEGNNLIIDVKLSGDATGLVLADINGTSKLFGELNNSAVKFTVNNLVAGDYDIKVTYLGDNNCNGVNEIVSIKVNAKEESNANITIPTDISIGGDNNVKIELPQKANGTVTLKIDGKVVSTTPVVNGSVNVSLGNLTSGSHIVEIAYSGDEKYAPVSATQIVKIEKQNVVIVVDKTFTRAAVDTGAGEKGAMFYAILKDANGNILANKTVQLAYNGVIYNKITDNQGRVGLQVNLPNAGTYPITISFAGDDNYNASPLTLAKLTVAKKKTTIKASNKVFKAKKKSKKISVTLKTVKNPYDKKTYLKSGKKVTLKVKGKTYTAKINKKGVAKFTIKLNKKGKYKAKIKFAGDNTYKASSKTIKIRIK